MAPQGRRLVFCGVSQSMEGLCITTAGQRGLYGDRWLRICGGRKRELRGQAVLYQPMKRTAAFLLVRNAKRPCYPLREAGSFFGTCRLRLRSGQRVQLFSQTGFFAGSSIFMNQTFCRCFVQLFAGSDQSGLRIFHIVAGSSRFKSFNRCTKSGFVGSVAKTALLANFYAFNGGFDVWHNVHLLLQLAMKR